MKKILCVSVIILTLFLPRSRSSAATGVLTTHFPPPPTGFDRYALAVDGNGDYFIFLSAIGSYPGLSINSTGYLSTENGLIISSSIYQLVSGSWVYVRTGYSQFSSGSSPFVDSTSDLSSLPNNGFVCLFSSSDFYNSQGKLLVKASDANVFTEGFTSVASTLTSSSLLFDILYSLKPLLIVIVIALAAFFSFRKAWFFLRSQVKGS